MIPQTKENQWILPCLVSVCLASWQVKMPFLQLCNDYRYSLTSQHVRITYSPGLWHLNQQLKMQLLQLPLNSASKRSSNLLPEIVQPHSIFQPRLNNYPDFIQAPLKMPPPPNDRKQSIENTTTFLNKGVMDVCHHLKRIN